MGTLVALFVAYNLKQVSYSINTSKHSTRSYPYPVNAKFKGPRNTIN